MHLARKLSTIKPLLAFISYVTTSPRAADSVVNCAMKLSFRIVFGA
jgi:hypothetical protein